MSELKEFTFCMGRYTEDGYPCVVAVDDEDNPRLASDEKFYLKSEADKVIADLEENHKKEVGQLLMEIVELKDIDSKNRSAYYKDLAMMAKDVEHHKYKRCLAMAGRCRLRGRLFGACGLYEKELWALKWHKRWLELAEKFKEAK